ncbi:MAG: response regulator [Thermodesulfobacteriota bacterium]|nr:response regulator [Thermodesulfobacteriota bacterium]
MDLVDKSRSTILVVDDDPVSLKLIRAMLEKNGYRTEGAVGGAECIQKTKSLDPDLVLLDITMPGMSGIEVCRALRQDDHAKNTPIIFVTASTDDKVLEEAFRSGGTDYVRKPINRVELLTRTESTLAQKVLQNKLLEEQKLNAILEMAGGVCHELNQPLQVILGYCQLLMMEISEDDPAYEMIDKIMRQIEKVSEITYKLMRITRYETREYVGDRKIVDIDKASVDREIPS